VKSTPHANETDAERSLWRKIPQNATKGIFERKTSHTLVGPANRHGK